MLHQNPKDTAESVSFGFLHSLKGSARAKSILGASWQTYVQTPLGV